MSNRSELHVSKLGEYREFCESLGWREVPTKGAYEVLRMRHPVKAAPLIVHRRENAEHLTVHAESHHQLNLFLGRRIEREPNAREQAATQAPWS